MFKDRIHSGISGLDLVLDGGLPKNRLYLVQGDPGAGKTTLGLHFLLAGAKAGERVLYLTLSETKAELNAVAESHGWSLKDVALFELSAIEESLREESQQSVFHTSEVELNQTTRILLDEVERIQPTRVVFDSLAELRLLSENALRFRRQILALKQYFSGRNCTVLLLDDRTMADGTGDLHVQSLAHGVIRMEQRVPEYGAERRRLQIMKMRGVKFIGGFHDFHIRTGGIVLHPRVSPDQTFEMLPGEVYKSGIGELDVLLGGGLEKGTSALIMGPAGVGKSTLSLQYALAGMRRGETAAVYTFEEGGSTLFTRTQSLGMDLLPYYKSKQLIIEPINPALLSPGEFTVSIRDTVSRKKASLIVIDSLNGYLNAMPTERFLTIQLRELLTFLNKSNVLTILVVAQHGLMGSGMQTPLDVSYLADTVMLLRYFEHAGKVRKAISVVKKRSGQHEDTIREFNLDSSGLRIGRALEDFHGVLTGVPIFKGETGSLLESRREKLQ